MDNGLGDDEQPHAVTYVRHRVLGPIKIVKVSSLSDSNVVTINIDVIEVINV
jgi:hypothetical protein